MECKECRSTDFLQTSGDVVCTECGLVSDGVVFDYPAATNDGHWEAAEPKRKRPRLFETVFPVAQDAAPEECAPKAQTVEPVRMSRIMKRLDDVTNHTAQVLGLSSAAVDSAISLLHKVLPESSIKTTNQRVVLLGCLYYACKQHGAPRTITELACCAAITRKRLNKTINTIGVLIDGHQEPSEDNTIESLIARCANGLQLPSNLRRQVTATAKKMYADRKGVDLQGKMPNTLAGVFIIKALAVCGISEVSVGDVELLVGVGKATLRKTIALL